MMSGTGKSGRAVFKSALASVLALLAFAMCAPQLAFADETTQAINGTMTITLQDGGGSGAVAGAGASALGKASSGTATGDALMWLILGVVVLIAGAVYIFIKSRRLAASAGASAGTSAGAHANVDASSKKKTIIVAVITALIACTCFGMFASKGVAFAKDTFNNIFGSSAVVVDNDGNVLSNNITIVNNEDEAMIVKSIEAPSALSDWNTDITDKTIESGKVAEGAWDGKAIPASVLEQLKNNDGYAELSFTMNVTDAKTTLNFEEFEVDKTAKDYTGQKITPTVSSLIYEYGTDYEVVYGENTNAGVGTITIKGIGDYKGEQTYIFTINKAPLNKSLVLTTVSVEETYDGTPLSAKEATASGLPEGNEVKLEYSLDGTSWIENASSLSITNVSESTNVQIRATSDANYEGTVETTAGLAVTEAPLTVTTPSQEKQYDGTALTAEGSITGFVNGETATFTTIGAQTNAGESKNTYSINWNGTAKQANYSITETLGTLKVTANNTPITVTVGDTSITYNGKVLTGDIKVTGIPEGFTYEAKTSGSQQDAGSSTCSVAEFIILDANKNNVTKNFSNITKNEGTLTVNKRAVTLTSESATKTYDGTALTKPTVTGGDPSGDTGFVSGEVTDIKATGTITNVGEVTNTITYNTNSTFKASNYTINKTEGTLTITAQSINPEDESYREVSIYDPYDVTYSGKEQKWVAVVMSEAEPLIENEDYTVGYSQDVTNVGTVTVTLTGTGNYAGTVEKTYKITPASLTVTTGSAEKVFDNTPLICSDATISGFVNNETATIKATGIQTEIGSSSNTYKITWGGTAKEANYSITKEELGTLTVKAPVTATVTGGEFTYDGQAHGATVAVTGLSKEYTVETATSNASATDVNGEGIVANVDNLVIKNAEGVDVTDSLNVKRVSGIIKITPAPLTVTTFDATKEYDGTALTAKGTISGFVNDDETATFKTTGAQTDLGESKNTYSITWDKTAKQNNYSVSATIGTLKVNKNTTEINVSVGMAGKRYDGTALLAPEKVDVTGLPGNFTYTAKAEGSLTDVGTGKSVITEFKINLNGKDVTDNFTNIKKHDGYLTVTQRPVTLTSATASKTYDGTALINSEVTGWQQSEDNTGFVTGEVTNVKATGTVTNVSQGNVANTITYDTASNFKADNYTITKNEGTLSITAQSIESGASSYDGVKISTPENVTYDGNEHKWVPTVTDKYDNPLKEGGDYNVTYNTDDFTNVGTITVIIAGIGNYTGTVTKTYQITDKVAFAVYSASTDGASLYFFKDTKANIDKAKADGSYRGVTISDPSDLYEGIESTETAPWKEHSNSITSVKVEDDGIAPTSTANWFNGCSSLTSVDLSKLDTSGTTEMTYMFADCIKLTSLDLSKFVTSKVEDMSGMFVGCSALTTVGNISEWDTSNVTDMESMFYNCSSLTADCSGWKVDKVGTTAHNYFNTNASKVTPPIWKKPTAFAVYSETDNSLRFYKDTYVPTEGIGETYNGYKVTAVYKDIESTSTDAEMPWNAEGKRENIKKVVVESDGIQPTSTARWFMNCRNLTEINVSKLVTSNVTNMKYMFYNIGTAQTDKELTLDLSNFTTNKVTDMQGMFGANTTVTSIKGPSSWDVSSVKNMKVMFSGCTKLTSVGDLTNWKTKTKACIDMTSMFKDCSSLTADCSGWDTSSVRLHDDFNTNAQNVKSPWDPKTAFAVYSTDGKLNFYKRATVPTEGDTIEGQTVATVYEGIETAEYTDTTVPWTKDHKKEITTVNFVDSIQPNNTGYWFYNLSNLTTVNAKNLDTSNVTSMRTMFSQCKNLQTIEGVSDWITSSVTDMRKTFKDCSNLTADCSSWDVGAVTQRSEFATNASGVTLPSAWSSQANASVASNSPSSTPATASVVAGEKALAVSTTSDNASVVAQNADGNSAINNEETATTEVGSTEGASEATNKASSTSESNTALQEVNCLSALSKENSSEVEMKAVA